MLKKYFNILGAMIIIAVGLLYYQHKPVINIAYMSDSKYLPYMMTSLHSVISNKKARTYYQVHIIAKDFTKGDIAKIKQMEQRDITINIYPAKDLALDFSHLGRFASFQIALQKIFIADYLKKTDKVLYLDADTLVQTDLSAVYQTDIRDKYAAAVKDGLMYQHPEHIKELNLVNKNFYFNSGVMLLNLDKMREDSITRKAIIYFNTHNEIFGDQDILNVIFRGKVEPLSYRYNCNSVFFEEKDIKFLEDFWNEKIPENQTEVYKNTAILHFAGHKPWTDWFTHAYLKPLWQQYADEVRSKYHIAF